MVCESCDTPLYDPQQAQRLMQYDRTYAQAMSHLAAGNFDQTIDLLRPLINQRPKEKKLYVAVFRAATQDFQDLEMRNSSRRAAASEAWDKLKRLNGLTGAMAGYRKKLYEERRKQLNIHRSQILKLIFAAALFAFCAGIFFENWSICVPCAAGLFCCLYKLNESRPSLVIKQFKRLLNDEGNFRKNPFL